MILTKIFNRIELELVKKKNSFAEIEAKNGIMQISIFPVTSSLDLKKAVDMLLCLL